MEKKKNKYVKLIPGAALQEALPVMEKWKEEADIRVLRYEMGPTKKYLIVFYETENY